ncbi:MAG: hypothetical protein Q9217_001738 [Psora testacea]
MTCARCQSFNDTFVVRTEHLCKDCLQKYVVTKVLKRLETNKIRGGFKEPEKTILVPISFGVSSVSLLHILDSQLKNRHDRGRHAGYTLHLLHVDHSSLLGDAIHQENIEALRQRFSSFQFTIVHLEACFDYGVHIHNLLKEGVDDVEETSSLDNLHRFQYILSAASSPTSKTDIVDITRRRLIAAFAQKKGCHTILYGDTTTRLAERTLSETAKGRGGFLPWLTTDGLTSDNVYCSFPMRDLVKKEVKIYAGITEPPLTPLRADLGLVATVPSSKDNTIDSLMRQYFEKVEESHPSIVVNAVSTASKLRVPPVDNNAASCSVCQHQLTDVAWNGDQQKTLPTHALMPPHEFATLCYGCARFLE